MSDSATRDREAAALAVAPRLVLAEAVPRLNGYWPPARTAKAFGHVARLPGGEPPQGAQGGDSALGLYRARAP